MWPLLNDASTLKVHLLKYGLAYRELDCRVFCGDRGRLLHFKRQQPIMNIPRGRLPLWDVPVEKDAGDALRQRRNGPKVKPL